MFLDKRYWAARAVKAAGVPVDDPVGVDLAEMLVAGAMYCQHQLRSKYVAVQADDLDYTVMSARFMSDSAGAVRRVVARSALPEEAAKRMLGLVRQGAYEVFAAEGRQLPA